jgi:hypothetical protein
MIIQPHPIPRNALARHNTIDNTIDNTIARRNSQQVQ